MTESWASEPRFEEEELAAVMRAMFVAGGVGADDAAEATHALLLADLRGVESHGIARLPGYIRRLRGGLISPVMNLTVMREGPSTIAFDAHNGLGLLAGKQAMERCIVKAQETGICMATVRHSNHFGIAGTYALMAAEQGLGGMAMTNSSALVVPTFSKEPMLGTNPIAFAVPTGGLPFCLDMSTSTVPFGKIEIARRAGAPIPEGWALDADGRSTTDPNAVQGLTPLGGSPEMSSHKGYGLGLMVEIFCAQLASSAWSYDIGASYVSNAPTEGTGHAFLAWRIDAFHDLDEFKADIDAMIARLRANAVSDEYPGAQVLIPGDPESEAEAYNREHGIPVRRTVLRQMAEVANECEVEFPFELD